MVAQSRNLATIERCPHDHGIARDNDRRFSACLMQSRCISGKVFQRRFQRRLSVPSSAFLRRQSSCCGTIRADSVGFKRAPAEDLPTLRLRTRVGYRFPESHAAMKRS